MYRRKRNKPNLKGNKMSNNEIRRGRRAVLSSRDLIMAALVAVRDDADNQPSAPVVAQLVEAGYLVKEKVEAETPRRGRPRVNILVAPKYRGQVALWEQAQAKRDVKAQAQAIADADARVARCLARVDEIRAELEKAESRLSEAMRTRADLDAVEVETAE